LRFFVVLRWCVSGALLTGLCFWPVSTRAAQAASPGNPAEVLRQALMAACSQNSDEFARVLTARNVEAFLRMTPAARSTLLKRFVLLDRPGTPRSETEAAGTLTIYCVTPELTTEMHIRRPELRDNLAYLPLTVKDATDSDDATAHQVTMGMVRENDQWRLLSLGLLLLDLPSLGEEWDRASIKVNEQMAATYLKELAEAVEAYRKTYTRLPDSLAVLGPAPEGAAKSEKAGLVGEELATGRRDGYVFRYVIVGANTSGAPAKYELAAIPAEYGRTGTRSFFRDSSGRVHAADHHGAVGSEADPKFP
jgi:hypothetical protein